MYVEPWYSWRQRYEAFSGPGVGRGNSDGCKWLRQRRHANAGRTPDRRTNGTDAQSRSQVAVVQQHSGAKLLGFAPLCCHEPASMLVRGCKYLQPRIVCSGRRLGEGISRKGLLSAGGVGLGASGDAAAFGESVESVGGQVLEHVACSAGPAHNYLIDLGSITQAEVDAPIA